MSESESERDKEEKERHTGQQGGICGKSSRRNKNNQEEA